MSEFPYKRILIKVSGEALMGEQEFGQDISVIDRICEEVQEVYDMGIQVCLVVGGGNIYRGVSASAAGMERASADYIGMLATVMNAIALQNSFERMGVQTRVLSAIPMSSISETYIRRKAIRHMEKKRIVIFAAGTGNPFFTTDTAAALRAVEMNCDALLKGTKVDGVYTADPHKDKSATKYESLSYKEVLSKDLFIMDAAAISLARENDLPIIIFSIQEHNSLQEVAQGKGNFSIIK
jgi:uridylate kinase